MTERDMTPRRPRDSESQVSQLMMPQDVNNLGNVFGGAILSMVDRAAAVAAMRHSRCTVVTVSIDRVDFKEPIYAGELVTCKARVNYVGRTSLEVGVRVEAENLLTVRRHRPGRKADSGAPAPDRDGSGETALERGQEAP